MNITLSGTKVSMDGHTLAFQKNNLVDSMVITVDTDETWQYKLDVKYPCKDSNGKELYNVIDLTRVGNTCTAILQASMLPFNGKYTMQLRGISSDKVYHTDTFDVWVKYSIDPGKVYDPVPSEFYQIESNITSMNNHPPKPGNNGYWLVWNVTKQEYEESDIPLPEDTLPDVSDSTNGWYLTNDGKRVYWAEVQGGSGEGDIAAIQVNGTDQPIVDKVAKLTIDKATVGLDNLDNVRQYSSVNQPPYPVTSVAGKTGAVTLTKADVGLGNVDNTSDANKPISTATQTVLNGKLDKTAVVDVTADAIKGQAADAKSVYDVIQALPTGSDLSLGLTAATVGQTIKVKAVDADGVPTAWEAVNIAKPCGWELINEITIPEGSDEILEFVINTDSNSQPFKLHRFMMFVHLPIYTGASEIPSYGYGVINGHKYNATTYSAPLIYNSPSEPSKTESSTFTWMEGDIMGDGNHMCIYGRYNPDVLSSGGFRILTGAGGVSSAAKFRYITGVPQSLYDVYRPITSVGLSGILMFAGCKVWLYGTRVQEDEA